MKRMVVRSVEKTDEYDYCIIKPDGIMIFGKKCGNKGIDTISPYSYYDKLEDCYKYPTQEEYRERVLTMLSSLSRYNMIFYKKIMDCLYESGLEAIWRQDTSELWV